MRNHLIASLAVFTLASVLLSSQRVQGDPPPDVPFLRGDTNVDGRVDLSDAILTLGSLFLGNGSLPCDDAADSDDSGFLDISDAVFLLSYLFLGQDELPAPFPGPGADPSSDSLGCFAAEKAAAAEAINRRMELANLQTREAEQPAVHVLTDGMIVVNSDVFDLLCAVQPGESLLDHLDVPGMPKYLRDLEDAGAGSPTPPQEGPADGPPPATDSGSTSQDNPGVWVWNCSHEGSPSPRRLRRSWTLYRPDGRVLKQRNRQPFPNGDLAAKNLYASSGPGATHNVMAQRYKPNDNTPRTSISVTEAGAFRVGVVGRRIGRNFEVKDPHTNGCQSNVYFTAEYVGDVIAITDEGGAGVCDVEALAQEEATFTIQRSGKPGDPMITDEYFSGAKVVQNGTHITKETSFELQIGLATVLLSALNVTVGGKFYREIHFEGRTGEKAETLRLFGVAGYDFSRSDDKRGSVMLTAELAAQGKAEIDGTGTSVASAHAWTRQAVLMALAVNNCGENGYQGNPLILFGGSEFEDPETSDAAKKHLEHRFKGMVPEDPEPKQEKGVKEVLEKVHSLLWDSKSA